MTPSTPNRHRWSPGGVDMAALAPGLGLTVLFGLIDLWVQPATAVVGLALVAPPC